MQQAEIKNMIIAEYHQAEGGSDFNMTVNVLIADDDALIREGLKIILDMDDEFNVAGCASDGLEAVRICSERGTDIDVVLLDVRMPVMNGLDAAREISEKTKVKPLILTTFDDDDFIMKALKSGARGYLLKNTPPEGIKNAIKVVNQGGTVMQNSVMEKVREGLVSDLNSTLNSDIFSDREMDIVRLISEGLTNREIASRLFITEGTVKNHVTSIMNKIGLEHRTQIAIYYLKGGK